MPIRFPLIPVFLFIAIAFCAGQLTITVTSIPANTPPDDDIHIAGNFNSWNPGDAAYQLTDNGGGTYSITFNPNPGTLEFKFTRGSWGTVEGTVAGGYIPNRTIVYKGGVATHSTTIAGWEDASGSAADNVQIYDEDFYMPQLDRTRRIWIYLPPDYETTTKRYPVIYMHDGQNLFDVATSFAGEWEIDESMNEGFAAGDHGAIVVGIDNGGATRFDEYSPWYNPTYGGGEGDEYISFLVNTLKPHIDSAFRSLPGRDYTAIAGSSMGGLISMYAIAEYPDVFSKAGIFSPAFWVADSAYTHVASKTFSDPVRIYFVASENESQSMIPDMEQMRDLVQTAGVDHSNLFLLNEPDGAHSEWFWAREYPDVYDWLFDGLVLSSTAPDEKKSEIIPNPARDIIYLHHAPAVATFCLMDLQGSPLLTGVAVDGQIGIGDLHPGTYCLQLISPKGLSSFSLFVKM